MRILLLILAVATASRERAGISTGTSIRSSRRTASPVDNKTTTRSRAQHGDARAAEDRWRFRSGDHPRKSSESLVVEAAIHTPDLETPPKNNKSGATNLTPEEIAVLKAWIDLGAKDSVQQERKVVWQPLATGVHPIYSVALTKDGRFAACGRSNQIQVYDLATRQFVANVVDPKTPGIAHRALVQSLAFSPDGTRLASGSFREVKVWKEQKVAPVVRKADPALGLVATTLSADGKTIAGIDKTGTLVMFEAKTGKVLKKIPGVAKSAIKALKLFPDGSKAAVFATGWQLSVWDLAAAKQLTTATTPDPTLDTKSAAAKAKLDAATKAEADSLASLKKAQEAKTTAATDPAKLAEATKNETVAAAAVKTAQAAKIAPQKAATDAAALANKARTDFDPRLNLDRRWPVRGHRRRRQDSPRLAARQLRRPQALATRSGSVHRHHRRPGPGSGDHGGEDAKVRLWSVSTGEGRPRNRRRRDSQPQPFRRRQISRDGGKRRCRSGFGISRAASKPANCAGAWRTPNAPRT